MDLDLSVLSSALATVLPYLSYLVTMFNKMIDTLGAFFNSNS